MTVVHPSASAPAPDRAMPEAHEPRVGLVLGAGGIVGQAFQAGVLAALEHDLGWDPRSADVIVGTSAGAITGTLLRLGIPAHDLAAWAVRAPLSVEGSTMRDLLGDDHPTFPPMRPAQWLRPWRLPTRALLRRVLREPWTVRPTALAMTLLPAGQIELRSHTSRLAQVASDAWPERLWLCAAHRDSGERVCACVVMRDGAAALTLPAVRDLNMNGPLATGSAVLTMPMAGVMTST